MIERNEVLEFFVEDEETTWDAFHAFVRSNMEVCFFLAFPFR